MGIRFYCPNGHKLNVKSFQAGRRGICPFCGAKIIIPTQSTRKSSKAERAAGGAPEAEHEVVLQPESGAGPAVRQAAPLPQDKPGGGPTPSDGAAPLAPTAAAAPVTAQPLSAPASTAATPTPKAFEATPPVASPSAPGPQGGSQVASAQPAAVQPVAEPAAPAPPASPSPPGTGTPDEPADPLAEAGNVVWYVRPPSGGQFGPATSDVMRTWITEGRVSADSLVWREGWSDWQEAGGVFPQLGSRKDEFGIDVLGGAAPTAHTALGRARAPRSRRQETVQQASIITLLILAVCALVGVFVWVVFFYPA